MQNTNTLQEYNSAVAGCKEIFISKAKDYGTSWRVLRTISIVDQLFIKAQRIKTIQERKDQKVEDRIEMEFKAIVNYGIIGLIQMELGAEMIEELSPEKAGSLFDKKISGVRELMLDKNHDYGEAWRDMTQESFVDLILMKLMRIRQILLNEGKTLMSEGIDANYMDIVNYALFALILIGEGRHAG